MENAFTPADHLASLSRPASQVGRNNRQSMRATARALARSARIRYRQNQYTPGTIVEAEDIEQSALVGLLEAAARYRDDDDRGASLITYATPYAAGAIDKCLSSCGFGKKQLQRYVAPRRQQDGDEAPDDVDAIVDPRAEAAFDEIEHEEVASAVRSALTAPEWEVIREVFWNDHTQLQIARSRHITVSAVSKTYRRALRKARAVLEGYRNAA